MAVFTPVTRAQADAFARTRGLGALRALLPIAEGVQNTNYRLETDEGVYVLTLFEAGMEPSALPFCLGLTDHLADAGLAAARVLPDETGRLIGEVAGRSAAILTWLPGAWLRQPGLAEVRAAGQTLAQLHHEATDFDARRPDPMGPRTCRALHARCLTRAAERHSAMLASLGDWLASSAGERPARLPRGPIHADYFPDNVLFVDSKVSGIIDFYFACTDALAYDVAVALSAWGFDEAGDPVPENLNAFLSGYEAVRPLTEAERHGLPDLGARAAVRFTLTRLHDLLFHDPKALVTPKDPKPFFRRLDYWRRQSGFA